LDREVVQVVTREFVVDNNGGIRYPLGVSGVRLEVELHIVTVAVAAAQNLCKSVERAGAYIEDIVSLSLATSEAVLYQDEKNLGVVLVDIGGDTTSLIVFSKNGIEHTAVLDIGGSQITNAIAIGLRTPLADAEMLKIKHGCARADLTGKGKEITVIGVGGRPKKAVPRQVLAEIIQPRVQDIFTRVKQELEASGYEDDIAAGLVLTGGTALLPVIAEEASDIMNLPVRIGRPQGISGLVDAVNSPLYAAAVGLVILGSNDRREGTPEQ
jgi:cell division protein FtsA